MKLLIAVALLGVLLLGYLLWHTFEEIDPAAPAAVEVVEVVPQPPTTPPTTFATTTTAPSSTTTTARARTAPTVRPTSAGVWDSIAACESGGRWNDTRGGYEGGLHWLNSTWLRAGGGRYAQHAYQATREQQITIADAWRRRTSWAQWPVCSRKAGLR
jgi:hypothetical protein